MLDGRYRLDARIAAGGMGEVWRGTDLALSRAVAVKLLHPEHASQPDGLARFRAEAQQAGSLSHPNIAQVYDYCEPAPPGPAYLVLELVDGPSLARHLDGGPLSPARTLNVIEQAAGGLAAAHQAGLLHRDIKPGNLLLSEDGLIKITDFGIARAAGSAVHTRTGALTGTPAYLAPERFAGAPATPATDLYALGVVAHQCLTGQLPFAGDPLVVALAHVERDMPPLPDSVPDDLAALVADLTRKDPHARPASAVAVLARAAMIRAAVLGSAANPASGGTAPAGTTYAGTAAAGTSFAGTSAAAGTEAGHTAAMDSPAGYRPAGPDAAGTSNPGTGPAGTSATTTNPTATSLTGASHTGTSASGTSATKTSFAGTSAAARNGAANAAAGGVPWPDAPGRHAPRRRTRGRSFLMLAGLATAALAGVVIWTLADGPGAGPARHNSPSRAPAAQQSSAGRSPGAHQVAAARHGQTGRRGHGGAGHAGASHRAQHSPGPAAPSPTVSSSTPSTAPTPTPPAASPTPSAPAATPSATGSGTGGVPSTQLARDNRASR
jgi:eukaryotic-like serine/threonine-protein kinase